MGYILSIDQGTTGTTSVLVNDSDFTLVGKVNHEYPQIYPQPGWVEHNLNDIWDTVEKTVVEVLKKNNVSPDEISSIGITNQRETTCAFDSNGAPLANAIVWQDRRTADFCEQLKSEGKESFISQKTGLPIDPYFSGTKMRWLLQNNEVVKNSNDLHFGTIDTFLLFKLTNGASYYTEATNASRTLLMDLASTTWDPELLDIFGVKANNLPEIRDSIGEFGRTKGLSFLPDDIPITGILGDQQAALFGQAGFNKGDMKCTYGTGSFILVNVGEKPVHSSNGLLATVGYRYKGKNYYALEGSSFIAGAAVQWLRDNLNFFPSSPEVEKLALEVKDNREMEHILFLPFFTGIGSPYWKADAKAAIVGLTRDSGKAHISRACLEGICFAINDVINSMRSDSGLEIKSLRVDGGAVQNNLLMEMQATISKLEIIRPHIIETTAFGAALAAGIGRGGLEFEQVQKLWSKDRSFNPNLENSEFYERKSSQWGETIKKLFL